MTASMLQIFNAIITDVTGSTKRFGRITDPWQLSIDGDVLEHNVTVAASSIQVLYDGSVDGFATATFLWCRAWYNAVLQVDFDTAGAYGVRYQTYYVKGSGEANKFGPALWLPDLQGYANFTTNFAAGTLVYPDKVRIKNLDASNANKIEFFCGD